MMTATEATMKQLRVWARLHNHLTPVALLVAKPLVKPLPLVAALVANAIADGIATCGSPCPC
jgi:hypothetical protein